MTDKEAFIKSCRFCAYRERALSEMRTKMQEWALGNNQIERVMHRLVEENVLNDLRFAEMYARSKVNYNRWGKRKIRYALVKKQVATSFIDKAIAAIDEEEYTAAIHAIAKAKARKWNAYDSFTAKQKALSHFYSKGFQVDEVLPILTNYLKSK